MKEIVVQEVVGDHAEAPLYGPWRKVIETMAWNGEGFVLQPTQYAAPVYRFQAVQDADRAFLRWDFADALRLYQQALNDKTLKGWSQAHFQRMQDAVQAEWHGDPTPEPVPDDPAEFQTLTAYVRYKTILLYLAQGRGEDAISEYERLQRDFPPSQPGSVYTEVAKAFWEAYSSGQDLASGCANARAYILGNFAESTTPIDNTWHGNQTPGYGYNEPRIETYMCPFD